jgi:hypothetical protein
VVVNLPEMGDNDCYELFVSLNAEGLDMLPIWEALLDLPKPDVVDYTVLHMIFCVWGADST